MKNSNFVKIFGVVFIVFIIFISIFIYNSFHGNSIGYIKAKHRISEYIEDNYNNELKINKIFYSGKAGGYIGEVEEIDNPSNKANINYYNTGYIGDDYHFRTYMNMSDEISSTLKNLIYQQTSISKDNMIMNVFLINVCSDHKFMLTASQLQDSFTANLMNFLRCECIIRTKTLY